MKIFYKLRFSFHLSKALVRRPISWKSIAHVRYLTCTAPSDVFWIRKAAWPRTSRTSSLSPRVLSWVPTRVSSRRVSTRALRSQSSMKDTRVPSHMWLSRSRKPIHSRNSHPLSKSNTLVSECQASRSLLSPRSATRHCLPGGIFSKCPMINWEECPISPFIINMGRSNLLATPT